MTKQICLIFFVTICGFSSWGQSDTTNHKNVSGVVSHVHDSLDNVSSAVRTLPSNMVDSLKSLKESTTHVITPSKVSATQERIDSLSTLAGKSNPLNILETQNRKLSQSLNLDSTKTTSAAKVNGVVDSLNNKMDDIRSRTDSLADNIKKGTIGRIGERGNFPLQQNGDLELPTNKISGTATLPSINALPEMQLPRTDVGNISSTDMNVNTNLPNVSVPEMPGLGKMNDITGKAQELNSNVDKAGQYQKEISDVKSNAPEKLEKLPADAEQKVKDMKVMQEAGGELTKAEQVMAKNEAMVQQYRDKKLLMDEMKRKSSNVVNDMFIANAGKVKAAQDHLTKVKAADNKIKNLKDVFRKRSTELDGKKFYQHLVPGITWQLYKTKDIVSTDLSLQLGYRFTPSVTVGAGNIYRVGFSDDFDHYVKGLRIYGARGFVDITLLKGIFAHGEFETLKLNPKYLPEMKEQMKLRVNGSYFGLGKRFDLSYKLRGNLYGLYRVNYSGELPNANRLSVRFGFEYVFKGIKRKRTSAILK